MSVIGVMCEGESLKCRGAPWTLEHNPKNYQAKILSLVHHPRWCQIDGTEYVPPVRQQRLHKPQKRDQMLHECYMCKAAVIATVRVINNPALCSSDGFAESLKHAKPQSGLVSVARLIRAAPGGWGTA